MAEDNPSNVEAGSDPVPTPSQPIDPNTQSIETTVGTITDVGSATTQYIKDRYFKRAIAVIVIIVILEIFWLYFSFQDGLTYVSNIEIAGIPIFVLFLLKGLIWQRVENAFMQEFASENNLSFQKTGLPDNLDGFLFSRGYGGNGADFMNGKLQDLSLCLFNYSYIVGTGRNSHKYTYTVLRLDYPSLLPPILLEAGSDPFGGSLIDEYRKDDPEKIQLEGDFNKYFSLCTQKGFETETLEVFAPDFMDKMESDYRTFSLEFIGNHVYIYGYSEITNKMSLDKMYSLAQYLVTKIGPLAERMRMDQSGLGDQYQQNIAARIAASGNERAKMTGVSAFPIILGVLIGIPAVIVVIYLLVSFISSVGYH